MSEETRRTNTFEIKAYDDNRVKGYGIIFDTKDLEGDTFTKGTEYGLSRPLFGMPVFYDHTLTGIKSRIGSVVDFSVLDDGIFVEIELDRHHQYLDAIKELIAHKAIGLSTGTMAHTVLSEKGEIKRWIIGEISLTPTPAEYRTIDKMSKSLEENTQGEKELSTETNEVLIEKDGDMQEIPTIEYASNASMKQLEDALETRFENIDNALKAISEQMANAKPVKHNAPRPVTAIVSEVNERENKSFGDFLWHVYSGDTTTLRNKYKAMSENTGSSGGYTVPKEFVAQLLQAVEANGVIEQRATVFTMMNKTLEVPALKHDSTYVDGRSNFHAGVHFTSVGEGADAATAANTQPTFEMITLTANKQAGVTKMSNELDKDSVLSLESMLVKLFTDALAYRKDWLFLRGSGAGEPLGIFNSTAYLPYDLTDAAPTVVELAGMRAKLVPTSYDKACWIVNPLLSNLIIGLDNDAVSFSNITGKPSTTLFGLPVYYSTAMPTTVATGGIMLADLGYYLIGQRSSLDIAFSAHTDFDTDEVKWRVVWRGDGQPWLRNPIPVSSSAKVAPFIVSQ